MIRSRTRTVRFATFVFACVLMSGLATSAHAAVLLSDNFDEANNSASTFNNNLGATQSGSLATVPYSVNYVTGYEWSAQHGNGARLLVASTGANVGGGSVSLNNNFATQANAADAPLQISFNITDASGYGDTTRWVQFNVGGSQHLDVGNGGVGVGVYFRVNGATDALSAGGGLGSTAWTANDLVTVTLSDTAGTGSAFNGNGSRVSISIGANNLGSFAITQQTNAYVTFSAYNYGDDQFGIGTFDNLNIQTVEQQVIPAPAALPAGVAMLGLALARRRR